MTTEGHSAWDETIALLDVFLDDGADVRDVDTVLDAVVSSLVELPGLEKVAGKAAKKWRKTGPPLGRVLAVLAEHDVVDWSAVDCATRLVELRDQVQYGYLPSALVEEADGLRGELADLIRDLATQIEALEASPS